MSPDDEQATLSDLGTDEDERGVEERRGGAVEAGESGSDLSPSSPTDDSQDDTGGLSEDSRGGGADGRDVWERECSREDCSYGVAVGGSAPSRSYPSECKICGADLQRPT